MAKAKTDKKMITTSIYVDEELMEQLKYAAGQIGVSAVLSQLGEKWLNEEIEIMLKPRKKENKDAN